MIFFKILYLFFFLFQGCANNEYQVEQGVMTISKEQTQSWVRNFNPLAPGANARWPSIAGIYEPLFITNSMTSEVVPWLGKHYKWKKENRVLIIETRDNVKWSDGKQNYTSSSTSSFNSGRRRPDYRFGKW